MERDYDKAMEWYQQAAVQENKTAQEGLERIRRLIKQQKAEARKAKIRKLFGR